MVREILGIEISSDWDRNIGGRDVMQVLTVPAYPALRKPVPPSRTAGVHQHSLNCCHISLSYQSVPPPCWRTQLGLSSPEYSGEQGGDVEVEAITRRLHTPLIPQQPPRLSLYHQLTPTQCGVPPSPDVARTRVKKHASLAAELAINLFAASLSSSSQTSQW